MHQFRGSNCKLHGAEGRRIDVESALASMEFCLQIRQDVFITGQVLLDVVQHTTESAKILSWFNEIEHDRFGLQ